MKHLVLLMIIIMIALVSCMPTTDTTNTSLEESSDPLNSVTSEATTGSDIEGDDSELAVTPELIPTSPQESDQDQVEPITEEEKSTMTPSNNEVSNPEQLPQVQIAKEDLANRLNISTDSIEIITVELVTWPNSGMGCPQPGMEYAQVPVDGLLIQLSVDGVEYNYHSGGSRDPFLCQPSPTSKSTPLGLNIKDFITPPSNNIGD
jgi:hypothetical protein